MAFPHNGVFRETLGNHWRAKGGEKAPLLAGVKNLKARQSSDNPARTTQYANPATKCFANTLNRDGGWTPWAKGTWHLAQGELCGGGRQRQLVRRRRQKHVLHARYFRGVKERWIEEKTKPGEEGGGLREKTSQ